MINLDIHNRIEACFREAPTLKDELEQIASTRECDQRSDEIYIGRYREFGERYFAVVIRAAASEGKIQEQKVVIPYDYQSFLANSNGCKIYCMNFFGVSNEQNKVSGISLQLANQLWMQEFRLQQPASYIGSRFFSRSENLGYFWNKSLNWFSARNNGEVISRWDTFAKLLESEWSQAKKTEFIAQHALAEARRSRQ